MSTDKYDEKNGLANEKIKLELLSESTRPISNSQSDTMQKSTKSHTTVNALSTGVGVNLENSSVESRQQKINSAPVLYLNKSQVLVDNSIKISDEKLDNSIENQIDLEANIVFDNSTYSLKSKSHQSVSDKLKNVGKIITDKFSKTKSSKTNIDTTSNDEDYDDDDYIESYDENETTSDYKATESSSKINKKLENAILYEENDEDADEDDNLIMNLHSDVEETAYFVNEAVNKQPPPLHLQLQQHVNNKKNDEVTVPMASPDLPSTSSAYLTNDNNCEKSTCENTDATRSNLLIMPTDLNCNSSFNSTTSRTSNSNNNNNNNNGSNNTNTTNNKQNVTFFQNNQHQSFRNLKKMTTQGSKAMRIMGNNDTMTNSNGPLSKINSPGDANNLKSSSGTNNLLNTNANSNKKQQKRLFFKNGNINISRSNIDKRRRRYLTDIFTTLIDLKWRYNALVFALGFFVSWIFFAILWYGISYIYGDLEEVNLRNKNYTACVAGISSFSGAILFSIETQQTIGYGVRYTTEKCPLAIFVMMLQSSMGVIIQSFMVGVVFAKLSRPKKRSETLMFSKNAVISLRDGRLCLICRVGDMRKSHIVEAHVRMYLIKKKVTLEGEIMPLHMYDLNVGWDKGLDRLFLVWPLTIEHYIDQNSPFWTLSAEDLKKERFEIAVILEGIVESTGMTTQARSSYLVNEILWGHRFEKLITFQKEDGTYKIDYSRFNMTVPVDTPTCSAKDLAELKEQEQFYTEAPNDNSNSPSTINSKEIIRADDGESLPASPSDLRRRKLDTKEENSNTNITYLTNESINKNNSNTIINSNSCEHSENNQKC